MADIKPDEISAILRQQLSNKAAQESYINELAEGVKLN
jgi:hypothetical protein